MAPIHGCTCNPAATYGSLLDSRRPCVPDACMQVELYTRESVIKHQPMVRNKDLGIGTLILTHL